MSISLQHPLLIANDAKPITVTDLRTRKSGTDWPQFLGPSGDSKSTETGIIKNWPVEGPKVLWELAIDQGYCMPTISKGRLFLFDRVRNENRLRCLNSENAKEIWTFKYPTDFTDMLGYSGGPRCSPTIDHDRVYVVGGEGVMHCLNVTTGKVIWKVDTTKKFGVVKNFFGVGCTPIIEGDLLIMQIGGSPPGEGPDVYSVAGKVKANGTGIVAFNKRTGKVVYKITNELASYASPTLTTIKGRRWCFMLCRSGLVAFEPKTGKVDFQYPWRSTKLESVNASNPIVIDDHVLISECYGIGSSLLKVKPGGYDLIWSDKDKRTRLRSLMTHWNTPIHIDGYVYGHSGRHSRGSDLRCIELKTGKIMWTTDKIDHPPLKQPLLLTRSSLLCVDGHFICLSEHGILSLVKINPKKFELIAATVLSKPEGQELNPKLNYPCWAAPIISQGLLYVRGSKKLICMELIPKK